MTAGAAFWAARFANAKVRPSTLHLLALADPRAGERVADIGCGTGNASALLRRAVGRTGSVVGVDISAPLLAIARDQVRGVTFVHADAATHRFAPLDLVFSEFGMTFFADPVRAFARFRAALAPAGRLAFSCYGARNAWLRTVATAARATDRRWRMPDLSGPGPFAFARRDALIRMLAAAGFARVRIATAALSEPLAVDRDAATELAIARPVFASLLAGHRDLDAVRTRVRRALSRYASRTGFAFPATAYLVTASVRRTAAA